MRDLVHLDGCVEVEAAYYGAPPGWIGQRVYVQWNELHVRLVAPQTGQLLREQLRAPRGWHRLHHDDRPARTPPSTVALLARAQTAGVHISAVCTYWSSQDLVETLSKRLMSRFELLRTDAAEMAVAAR